jgi:predicted transcriptional regulator
MSVFIEELKKKQQATGLPPSRFAKDILGINHATLWRIFHGKRDVENCTLGKILTVYPELVHFLNTTEVEHA